MAFQFGVQGVILEGDSLQVVKKARSLCVDLSPYGTIVIDIRHYVSWVNSLSIRY